VFHLPGPIHLPQETGLTLLEQDFESALAAIPSGNGEGVYEGLRTAEASQGKRTSLFARALSRQLQPLPRKVG
jgi:hypothetical protein